MSFGSRLAFSALLCPAGVHLIGYRRVRGELEVERYTRRLEPFAAAERGAQLLAEMLEAEGARGRPVSIVVTGFGVSHQTLTLPPAGRELLQPIVARELRRFYPQLFAEGRAAPVIDFAQLAGSEQEAGPAQKELLVAAVPGEVMHAVIDALTARGVALEHWAVAPRAVQRVRDAFGGDAGTGATLLLVPGWPLLGFFHQGALRLFSEPGAALVGQAGMVATVAETVERGAVFLRQQFRGAAVDRLLVAAEHTEADGQLVEQLRARLAMPLEALPAGAGEPGALAALGGALDANAEDGLNLLPPALRPPSRAERQSRILVAAGVALLLLAGGWWATRAHLAERRAGAEVETLQAEIASLEPRVSDIRPLIEERRAHAQRSALIGLLGRDRRRLAELLWPLQTTASPVRIRHLSMSRLEGGWQVTLGVRAVGRNSAEATDALLALYHQLGAELPEDALAMSGLVAGPGEAADSVTGIPDPSVAASVELSFVAPAGEEEG